jgi:hypothetical protein
MRMDRWRHLDSFTAVFLAMIALSLAAMSRRSAAQEPVPANAPYKNSSLPVDRRVADLLGRMTLEEKATMLSGSGWMESAPIERLGIPAIKMADGPMGVRSWLGSSAITSGANATKIETTSLSLRHRHGRDLGS